MKDLYTARVAVTGGRDGSAASDDGKLSVKLGFPKALGGSGESANPEQLFVAGFAACFASTLKAVANNKSLKIGDVAIDGEATLSLRDDGAYTISRVKLTVAVDGLGERGDEVIEAAKRVCAYSNATRGNVVTDVVLA